MRSYNNARRRRSTDEFVQLHPTGTTCSKEASATIDSQDGGCCPCWDGRAINHAVFEWIVWPHIYSVQGNGPIRDSSDGLLRNALAIASKPRMPITPANMEGSYSAFKYNKDCNSNGREHQTEYSGDYSVCIWSNGTFTHGAKVKFSRLDLTLYFLS